MKMKDVLKKAPVSSDVSPNEPRFNTQRSPKSQVAINGVEAREALHAAYLLTQKNIDSLSYKLLRAYQERGALIEIEWEHVLDLLRINAIVESSLSVMPKEKSASKDEMRD